MSDDTSIAAASFADPFVLLIKENGRIAVLRVDDSGDFEEITISESLFSQEWKSGSLYDDVNDTFRLTNTQIEDEDSTSVLLFLLSNDGGLQVHSRASIMCMANHILDFLFTSL